MAISDRPRSRLAHPALTLLVPLALAVAAYWRVLGGEFQFDDTVTVEQNLEVKDLRALLGGHLARQFLGGGRPVADLTFAANYAVGGLDPWNFHLTNLAIHLAVVVLVWAFTRSVLRLAAAPRPEWLAVLVAGAFAVHPIESEAVSYVSQRSEALASGFYVAALLLLFAAERRGLSRRGAWAWLAALATFVLALGSKAIAVTLPAAWLLAMAVLPPPERRAGLPSWPRRAAAAAPFAATAALYAGRTLLGLVGGTDAGFAVPGVPPRTYFLTELRAIPVYLRLLFWPAGQNVDWAFPASRSAAEPAVLFSGLFLLALAAAAVALALAARRRSGDGAAACRVAAFGVLWFFLVLSPTSSFVPLEDGLVEHRLYLASWGVLLASAVGAERLVARAAARWRLAPGAALALAAALAWALPAAALHRRNAVWETRRALWSDSAAKSPRSARAHLSLAYAAQAEGKLEESIRLNLVALELAGGDPRAEVQILRNLGAAYVAVGRLADGEEVLRRVVSRGYWDPDVLNNLAIAVAARGDLDEAERLARRAISVAPWKGLGWNALGQIMLRRGNPGEALRLFEKCLEVDPDIPVAGFNRGVALAGLGRTGEACATWAAVDAAGNPNLRDSLSRARAQLCERR